MNKLTPPLKVAVVGPGFWARFQVRAWRELERQGLVQLVALCGRKRERTEAFALELGSPTLPVYTDLDAMLREVGGVDLVDLITPTPSHHALVHQVLAHRIPVIVQKPMAQTLSQAISMVRSAQQAGVPLLVHEDYRWQAPFVRLKQLITEWQEQLGPLIDIRIEHESGAEDYLQGQPYFAQQPFLVNGEVGVHLIDLLRFLSGRDVVRVASAHMHRGVDERYRGEDVVHVTLDLKDHVSAAYRVAFSAARQDECPPQTFARMTYRRGTIELGPDYEITVTRLRRKSGITREVTTLHARPEAADWTRDPSLRDYQSWLGQWESCLPTNRACADHVLRKGGADAAATTGEDNLNVLATMFGAYLAAKHDTRIEIPGTIEELEDLARQLDLARIGYPEFPAVNPTVP